MNHAVTTLEIERSHSGKAGLGYRDIMVHLDGSAEDEVRLAHAEALATRFGAHLTGLHANVLPDVALYGGEYGGIAIPEILNIARSAGDTIRKALVRRMARLNVANELRTLENFPGLLYNDVAAEARWADLFVASCPYTDSDGGLWSRLVESVMFESGHGVYLVPQEAKPRSAINTIVIGWVDTREAARAVAESLPLLNLATKVELVGIAESNKKSLGGAEKLADIATHLDRRGIATTVSVLSSESTAAAALLDEAHRISADLIVSGAYGHSRLREWVLGGTTRDLIAMSDLPILMAH